MNKSYKKQISEFLIERKEHYKPCDSKIQGCRRLNKIDFSGNIHLSDKSSKTNMILVKTGDLVISGINVAKGAIAIYNGKEPITATIHYSSYVFDENIINIEYFKRFVKSPIFIQLLKEKVKGGIKTEIKPKHLLPLEIYLPNLTKQKNVVNFFNNIETEISELNSEIESQANYLKKLRQAILQEAIEGKLTADWRKLNPVQKGNPEYDADALLEKIKFEKEKLIKEKKIKKPKPIPPIKPEELSFELPKGWKWCRLGDYAIGFQYGSSSKSLKVGKVPVLRMGNIQNGKIDWKKLVFSNNLEEIAKYSLTKGDLLFNRTNSRELVGKTALFDNDKKTIYAGYLVKFSMLCNTSSHYANIVMNSTLHRNWCNIYKADAIGQSNINATKLKIFSFPVPPLSEQSEIVDQVTTLLSIVDKLEEQVTDRQKQAKQLMQSVLKEAFNNKEAA